MAEVYFSETFDDDWFKRWEETKKFKVGKLILSPGKYSRRAKADEGLYTMSGEHVEFYGITASFTPFSNENKTLIIQYQFKSELKFSSEETGQEETSAASSCTQGHVRLGPPMQSPADFDSETPYYIQFGPDSCTSTREGRPETGMTHAEFYFNERHIPKAKRIGWLQDRWQTRPKNVIGSNMQGNRLSHLYTLTIKPDSTVRIDFDTKKIYSGKFKAGWELGIPKFLDDEADIKPADWVDLKSWDDPDDQRPDDWDPGEEYMPDPNKTAPAGMSLVGWTPPMVKNPNFKGEWKPRQVPNPAFKGKWEARLLRNPDYGEATRLVYNDIGYIGLLWQQDEEGVVIDNILITDDKEQAKVFAAKWQKARAVEDKLKERELYPDDGIEDEEL